MQLAVKQERRLFVLTVKAKDGTTIDVSQYQPDSLVDAARIGHVFQAHGGFTVTITDKGKVPEKSYVIDGRGGRFRPSPPLR